MAVTRITTMTTMTCNLDFDCGCVWWLNWNTLPSKWPRRWESRTLWRCVRHGVLNSVDDWVCHASGGLYVCKDVPRLFIDDSGIKE
jgi:hypothetical protein